MDDPPEDTTLPPDHWFRDRQHAWEMLRRQLNQQISKAAVRADKAEAALRDCRRELERVQQELSAAKTLLRSLGVGDCYRT